MLSSAGFTGLLLLLVCLLLSACGVSGQSSSTAVTTTSTIRSASTCSSDVVWIEEGPYFVDGQAELSDVRQAESLGIPLNVSLLVLDGRNTTAQQCVPLANVKIDIWACNWDGIYSDESSEDSLGETWLRGYQLTNASGEAQFATLYPGWYSGRTPHLHFRLRLYDGTDGALSYDETLQVFFNDSLTDFLYSNVAPYTLHTGRTTYNNDSTVYTLDNQLNLTGDYVTGYQSELMLTIPLGGTTSNYILGNATNTGGGGDAGAGSTTSSGNSSSSNPGGGGPGGSGSSGSTPSGGGPGQQGSSGANGSGAGGGPGSSGASGGGLGSSGADGGQPGSSSANAGGGGSSAGVDSGASASTTAVSNSGSSAGAGGGFSPSSGGGSMSAAGGGSPSSASITESSSSSTHSAQFSSLAAAVLSSSSAGSNSAGAVSVSSTATRSAEVYVPRHLLLVMKDLINYLWYLANGEN